MMPQALTLNAGSQDGLDGGEGRWRSRGDDDRSLLGPVILSRFGPPIQMKCAVIGRIELPHGKRGEGRLFSNGHSLSESPLPNPLPTPSSWGEGTAACGLRPGQARSATHGIIFVTRAGLSPTYLSRGHDVTIHENAPPFACSDLS